jgi:stage II sporulation protein D
MMWNLIIATLVTMIPILGRAVEEVTEVTSPRTIHVLIQRDQTEALLEVKGSYLLFNPQDGSKICAGVLGKRFMVHALPSGLKWGEEFPGIHQFALVPRGEYGSIFVNGIQYGGTVYVYAVGDRIHLINELDVESYVKNVLALQFSSPLESEVMAALAIVARTNAYYATARSRDAFWHVQAKEVGYQGTALCAPGSPFERAVDSTRNLILVHSSGGKSLPFAATWTEHSAGKTAPYQTMFRKEVFSPFTAVDAPHAGLDRKETKWSSPVSKKTLASLLGVKEIKDLELFVDASSNKVYGMRVKDQDYALDFDFFSLQEKLGKERLKSSDFTISMKGESILFTGFGRGHGVGLCLYSASAMAQNGDNAMKILSKFFPDTYLMNLSATRQKEFKRL